MDRIEEINTIVRQEIIEYNHANDYKAKGYFLEDSRQRVYSIIIVPNHDHPFVHKPDIMMMARVIEDKVVIDEDRTDRPLYQSLVRAGIPREQIILSYAGEKLPAEMETEVTPE